jgi:hypothetical protein
MVFVGYDGGGLPGRLHYASATRPSAQRRPCPSCGDVITVGIVGGGLPAPGFELRGGSQRGARSWGRSGEAVGMAMNR